MADLLPARPLDAIARDLRAELDAADYHWRQSVAHAVRAGGLLTEAKAQLAHGEWLPWLDANFPGSRRTAQAYMQLAERAADAQRLAHLGVAGALRALAEPRPETPRERRLRRFLSTRFPVGVAGSPSRPPDAEFERAARWCLRQGVTRLVGQAADAAIEVAREAYGPEAAGRMAARRAQLVVDAQLYLDGRASEPGEAVWDDTVLRAPRWRWTT